jgi:hypothetical protein
MLKDERQWVGVVDKATGITSKTGEAEQVVAEVWDTTMIAMALGHAASRLLCKCFRSEIREYGRKLSSIFSKVLADLAVTRRGCIY